LAVFAALLGFCISAGLGACGSQPRQAASNQSPVQGPALDQIPVLSSAHPGAAPAAGTTAPGSEGGPATGSPARGPGGDTFSCVTLTVPLDHSGLHPGPNLAEQVAPFPTGQDLPAVPALLLAGDHDLSTPLLWAQQEAARAPQGHLVVIPGSGHSTQSSDNGAMGRAAVTAFLTSP
jgi:pimeloyl-ACP methyl ester carboxylesterase